MCGIAGGSWKSPPPRLREAISQSLRKMAHRGPDDQGFEVSEQAGATTVVSQSRLSIIDLTSGGHQPMVDSSGRLAMVFNGEIYNYLELRTELRSLGHDFTTQSDGEVLLAAWGQWGQDCLTRLTGMFAIAVHDRSENSLTLVRDAFGIKPLFYVHDAGRLVFASELPPLLTYVGGVARPNLQRGYDYVVHGDYDSNEDTFVEGVRHLLPGHILTYDCSAGILGEVRSWWKPPTAQTWTLGFDAAVEAVRELFLQNIRLHLRSDVPIGAALSGGIDSSAVVCAMRYVDPGADIRTFSYIAAGSPKSEEKWVDLVNAAAGAQGHKVVAKPHELAEDLDELVRVQGEPFGTTSIYAQYRVYKLARSQGITVTLDGQGADELLAGYFGYPGPRMRSLAETAGPLAMHGFARRRAVTSGLPYHDAWAHFAREVLPRGAYAGARALTGREAAPAWLNLEVLRENGVQVREPRIQGGAGGKGRRLVERLANALQVRGLPHLLRHGDRNSMAFSIESRVPFLTTDFAELLLSMPENYLLAEDGTTKYLFRAAMRGIVPDAVLDRQDKIGFETPERAWFMALGATCRSWLDDADQVPFLRRGPLMQAFDAKMADDRVPSRHLWRLINYVRWHAVVLGRY